MSSFSPGSVPASSVTLPDRDGTSCFAVKDSDGFTIFKVDSKGNVSRKGRVDKL